jgi:hypothetical protein
MLNGSSRKSHTIELVVQALLVGTCAGGLLAMLAPYETAAIFSARDRFLFWIVSAVFGCLTLMVFYVAGRSIAHDYRIYPVVWLLASAALAAVPVTLIVHAVAPAVNDRIELQNFWKLFPSVLILCIPLQFVIRTLVEKRSQAAHAEEQMALLPDMSPLLDKLPSHLGGDIICLKMEDHYLRVYTPKGNALILMRISDAVKLLASIDGMRVHRSWWAARNAVRRTRIERNNLWLVLQNDLEIPVSRERRSMLEAMGWPGF